MTPSPEKQPSSSAHEHRNTPAFIARIRKLGRGILRISEREPLELQSDVSAEASNDIHAQPREIHEATEPTAPIYQQFEAMLQPEASPVAIRYAQQLQAETNQRPQYEAIVAHEQALQAAQQSRVGVRDNDTLDQLDKQVEQLFAQQASQFDRADYRESIDIYYHIRELTQDQRITLPANNNDARSLLALINEAPSSQNTDSTTPAPFANYQSNTDEAWAYVPSNAVRNFLDSKSFIPGTEHAANNATGYQVTIEQTRDDTGKKIPVAIASHLIVNAAGFDSWQGRGFDGEGDKSPTSIYAPYESGRRDTSHTTLKHYAGLPTELPPVGVLNIYIQPDGKIFADNDGGDSHRIAAALLRGNEFIEAESVNVRLLVQNMIS